MQILARQTRAGTQVLWRNKVWGDAANRYHATLVRQQFPDPKYEIKIDQYFKNPIRKRFHDVAVSLNGEPKQCYEVKTGNSRDSTQERVDRWINENKCSVGYAYYPACPVNLSEYTNCRVQ